MALTKFGEKTQTIFLKHIENHKLHQEFEVAPGVEVKIGQPVILNTDGEIEPAGAAAPAHTIIGYSIHNAGEDDVATVGMKAYAIVWAYPNAAVDAGPVAFEAISTTDDKYMSYAAAVDGTTLAGWAIDPATAAGDRIRVAVV